MESRQDQPQGLDEPQSRLSAGPWEALDAITAQLKQATDGDLDQRVRIAVSDERVAELVALINDLLDGVRKSADEAEARTREMEQFAYVASHDLQEPLRIVSSFLALLQRRHGGQLDDTAHEYITFAIAGSQRMQLLIRDLLDYSRVATGRGPLEPVDLNEVVDEVLRDQRADIQESGAEVARDRLPTVNGDLRQMVQLFGHLIANALKFRSEKPPRVVIDASHEGSWWHVRVRDNGIGIPAEQRERVFQIFHRLHSRDAYDGTGAGLAMCERIVEVHGGRIWIESDVPAGTVVHLTLPAVAASSE